MLENLFKAFLCWCVLCTSAIAQNTIGVNARLVPDNDTIEITQTITYQNNSQDTLKTIYLNDWAHSFSSKETPLAVRFAQDFEKKFHLAKDEERGFTDIKSIYDGNTYLQYKRLDKAQDIIEIHLKKEVLPNTSYNLKLVYKVKLPYTRFTNYGVTKTKDYNLRYWYITPAIYDGEWHYYSNKNLVDRYYPNSDIQITFSFPKEYEIITDFETRIENTSYNTKEKIAILNGKDRINPRVYLTKNSDFEKIETDFLTLHSNIEDRMVGDPIRALIVDRIAGFMEKNLGKYPHKKLLITKLDYKENQVYGLNQLPDFIRPFPEGFKYEIKLVKTIINKYVDNTLLVNPRTDRWIIDGIKVNLMQRYIDTFYPDLKVVGNLDKYWLVRQFYLSKLEFNDQYNLLYMNIARLNLDQPLSKPYDSLIKYNVQIANAYKSGAGLRYLGDFLEDDIVNTSIKEFYTTYNLQQGISSKDFENLIRKNTSKDVDWFFDEYVTTRRKLDFKIKNSKREGDSLLVTIKNKRDNPAPISVYGLKDGEVVSKTWVENIDKTKTVALAADSIDKVILNYDEIIPEYNLRDSYHNPNGFLGLNKPIQLKFLQDFENPSKNQAFIIPTAEFNIYDGLSPGLKLYNNTILRKNFRYKFEPQFGLRSKAIIGKASLSYTHFLEDSKLFSVRYGISGNRSSFGPDLFFERFVPFLNFSFKPRDFRANKGSNLSTRFVRVQRDEDFRQESQDPDYSVFNLRFSHFDRAIINTVSYNADLQIAKDFAKVSSTFFYRHLYLNNRQLNLRFYAGAFLRNNTRDSGDFFSFALDRPTDYLFDFNYYGRSEDSGIFSQQFIFAEGGFKSRLQPAFANQFITTINASTTLWKYIYAYGDIGLVKNRGFDPEPVYDTGVQVSLLDDYFEIFLPVYSNLGWEIAQPNYDQKIRFIVSLDIDTLVRLFQRRWY